MNRATSIPFPGHALFVTRIGVCGLAWNEQAITAVQLPELTPGETRDRMLLGLHKRRSLAPDLGAGFEVAVSAAQDLPAFAVQAVAGVQRLLAGKNAELDQGWAQLVEAHSAQGVLGDLRKHYVFPANDEVDGLLGLEQISLNMAGVPEFHRKVYAVARQLRPGQTCTYGEMAKTLGEPGAARAVGQALGANPFAPIVPCHQILAAGGKPGGFSGGQGAVTKLRMLEIEGAAFGGSLSLFAD
jgi:methylated-DNA-[protein]-cysteine S-methyltransferase